MGLNGICVGVLFGMIMMMGMLIWTKDYSKKELERCRVDD